MLASRTTTRVNPAAASPSSLARSSSGICGSPRDCRPAAPPAPSNRETPPAASSAGNPAILRHAPFLKRFERRRSFVAQHSRQQPRHRVDHHRRRQFAAAQHIIADRDLFVGQVLGHALVHAFVAAADQQQLGTLAQAGWPCAWSNSRPCAESSTTFCPARAFRPDRFHRREDRLATSAPCLRRRRTAGRPPSCAGRASSRADCVCGCRAGPRLCARFTTPCSNGPSKNSGKIVSTWKITSGSSPSILRAIPPRCVWPRDRSPRRSIARTESAARRPPPAARRRRHRPSAVTRPSDSPRAPVDHLAADQVGLEVLALVQRRPLAGRECALRAPYKRSASEMVSTPRNLNTSVRRETRSIRLRTSRRPAGPPGANRKTSLRA